MFQVMSFMPARIDLPIALILTELPGSLALISSIQGLIHGTLRLPPAGPLHEPFRIGVRHAVAAGLAEALRREGRARHLRPFRAREGPLPRVQRAARAPAVP